MALHKEFPADPHAILLPGVRWFPADGETHASQLMPPLVTDLRKKVHAWRTGGYEGASETSRSLLTWWFQTPHLVGAALGEFQYYFAQREALETIIYLYDAIGVKDKYDLMRYDLAGVVSAKMFDETWRRFVVKMATGAGKTKVLSLVLAWSFFHKLYEPDSTLARNFLVIAPNIIVLDRIKKDFQGLYIFFHDPVLPDNGYDGRDWRNDFQLTLHLQDEVRVVRKTGNIFLTNIHRVYAGNETIPTADDDDTMDYYLGKRPSGATTDSKVDLGMIVREIEELAVLNDEAHHIHDPKLAWFQSIQDIHNRLLQKGATLALQVDVTATPRSTNGAIFVQTVSDYPLVEAIAQNVVKHPVLPDAASRAKLQERQSTKFSERYADYLNLGVIEWQKTYAQHAVQNKKAILFVMTDDTKNCDEVAAYLESMYAELKDAVLVIHTKNNGEISESVSGKNKDELIELRKQANDIDNIESKYKAIVSVLVLKEGWDVRNVTTIVGLRAYSAKSNILPEQTLGRGLRKMYPGRDAEFVSVIGTSAFMDFVESIEKEGVILERKPMGEGSGPNPPLLIEIEDEKVSKKDLAALDIEIPILSPRIYREYKNLNLLEPATFGLGKLAYRQFPAEELREIDFKDVATGEFTHTTILDTSGIADSRSLIGFFAQTIMKDLRLVSGYDVLYGKVKAYVRDHLFDAVIDLEDPNTLRNLTELEATKTTIEGFKKAINALTVQDKGTAQIRATIKLSETRPFVAKDQGFTVPKLSAFNRIIGDSNFELEFATFLDRCAGEIVSFAKNYLAVGFKLDYVTASGDISNYYPDFFVKVSSQEVYIVETKGLEDLDVPPKMARLRQWCDDVNAAQQAVRYDYLFVDEEGFQKYPPTTFAALVKTFRGYKV